MKTPKGIKELEKVVRPHGWTWEISGSGHIRWRGPNGEQVFTGKTPSDNRAFKNALKDFRNQGCPV